MDQVNAIRTFMRVVETGSLTRAATSLDIPKSTASKLLADLEAYLGVKLLVRSTRSVNLTAEGAGYYDRVGQVMASLTDADNAVREHSAGPRGRVRVDVHSSMAHALLIPALHEFRALYPDIQLAMGVSDKPISLIEEAVDCVVRLGRPSDTSLIIRTIYEDRLITCASPSYLAGKREPTTPDDLRGHSLIGYFSAGTGVVLPFEFENDEKTATISNVQLLANDSAGQIQMMLAGLGIGQLYYSTVREHLETGRLIAVLDDWTTSKAPISVLYPPSKALNSRTRLFIDWFTDHLRRVTR